MAASDFSWFKLASFFGAALLAILCFATIAGGINLVIGGNAFNGVLAIVSGIICGGLAVLVYRNYQKKTSNRAK